MPRTRSRREARALTRALSHPAIEMAQVITGLLLQVPVDVRRRVLVIVEASLALATVPGLDPADDDGDDEGLRLHDGEDEAGSSPE